MDNLYVLIVVDRHCEPYAKLFVSLESALEYVNDCLLTIDEIEYIDDEPMTQQELDNGGWLYHKRYNCEDDYFYIAKQEVIK